MSEGTMASLSTAAAQAASVVPFLSVHAVRIFVRDLDRSLRFYIEQLGFWLVIDTRLQSGERWVASPRRTVPRSSQSLLQNRIPLNTN